MNWEYLRQHWPELIILLSFAPTIMFVIIDQLTKSGMAFVKSLLAFFLKLAFTFSIGFLSIYPGLAFVSGEFNPSLWSRGERIISVVLAILAAYLIGALYREYKKEIEKLDK